MRPIFHPAVLTEEKPRFTDPSIWVCALLTALGVVAVLRYGYMAVTPRSILPGIALLSLASACFAVGGLVGFLFGVPRSRQEPETPSPERGAQTARYRGNTNLEQLSDWLTKILVGAGLAQIGALSGHLQSLAAYWAPVIGLPAAQVQPVIAGLVVFFGACGFMITYLWARLYLGKAFIDAEEIKIVQKRLSEVEQQTLNDAHALRLLQRALNPEKEGPAVSDSDIDEALRNASEPVREQARTLARAARREAWRSGDRKRIASTIPIFQALLACGDEGKRHQTHAQLGYALKDQAQPDLRAAELQLSRAIDARGPADRPHWALYEFNRAVCRIMLDPAFNAGPRQASAPALRGEILADLRVVKECSSDNLLGEEPVKAWLTVNSISEATWKSP